LIGYIKNAAFDVTGKLLKILPYTSSAVENGRSIVLRASSALETMEYQISMSGDDIYVTVGSESAAMALVIAFMENEIKANDAGTLAVTLAAKTGLVGKNYKIARAADASIRDFARRTMREDLERRAHIPGAMLNFHPGSHVKQGTDVGIKLIAQMLDEVYTSELPTTVLLETMSGKGSEVGRNFDELRAIMDASKAGDRLGVCLDTCHVYDGGYDIVSDLDGVLAEFDRIIGLDRLKAIHLNDSKNPFASHKDRHEKIGEGALGLEAMVRIINHPRLRHLPFYLETPNELDGYAAEIKLLRSRYEEEA
jgi:deoxyribonuclease-4